MPRRQGGGLVGLLGKGVSFAAEYHEHRKDQKQQQQQQEQQYPRENNRQATSTPDEIAASSRAVVSSTRAYPSAQSSASYSDLTSDKQSRRHIEVKVERSSEDEDSLIEDDEEAWELDEAAECGDPPAYDQSQEQQPAASEKDLIQAIMNKHRLSGAAAPHFQRSSLPLPVILPQRRPGKKGRGFVRAYAPLLGESANIDQETFLLFIESFEKASQASPVFPIVQVASGIVGLFVPGPISLAVTASVTLAAQAGEQLQARQRTNTFLDKVNEQLFKPAGLYAMIIQYQSEQEVQKSGDTMLARFGVSNTQIDLDTNQAIAKYNTSGAGSGSTTTGRLRLASGTTQGAAMLPRAAPLIYPEIDRVIERDGPETFKDKTKDFKTFLGDYMDKRAQMKYALDDPNSSLNVPEEQRAMKSKLSDPSHPMFNGGLIGLVSGGALSMGAGGLGGRRGQRDTDDRKSGRYRRNQRGDPSGNPVDDGSRRHAYNRDRSYLGDRRVRRPDQDQAGSEGYDSNPQDRSRTSRRSRGNGGGKGGMLGGVKKLMNDGVLYLTIVALPSEADLAKAREILTQART